MGKGTRAWQFLWLTVFCAVLLSVGSAVQAAAWGDWEQVRTKLFFMPFLTLIFGTCAFLAGLLFKNPSNDNGGKAIETQSEQNSKNSNHEIHKNDKSFFPMINSAIIALTGLLMGLLIGLFLTMHPILSKKSETKIKPYEQSPETKKNLRWYITYNGRILYGTPYNSMQDCEKNRALYVKKAYEKSEGIFKILGGITLGQAQKIGENFLQSQVERAQELTSTADSSYCQSWEV